MPRDVRVLPPDEYDALELGAEMVGGIRQGLWWDHDGCPNCAHGIAAFVTNAVQYGTPEVHANPVSRALRQVGIGGLDSDWACEAINERKGRDLYTRVTFAEWCKELGVVRGT